MARRSVWTPEMESRLAQLVELDLSGGEIANKLTKEFGLPFTRCMVSGKTSRMRFVLSGGHAAERRTKGLPPKTVKVRPLPTPKITRVPPSKSLRKEQSCETIEVNESSERFTLLELPVGGCRWEVTGSSVAAAYRFCGKVSIDGKPYCAEHLKAATVPYQPVKKVKGIY